MTFGLLKQRGPAIGQAALSRRRAQIITDAVLPPEVHIAQDERGIILSGRGLRRRMIADISLRQFIQKGRIV